MLNGPQAPVVDQVDRHWPGEVAAVLAQVMLDGHMFLRHQILHLRRNVDLIDDQDEPGGRIGAGGGPISCMKRQNLLRVFRCPVS